MAIGDESFLGDRWMGSDLFQSLTCLQCKQNPSCGRAVVFLVSFNVTDWKLGSKCRDWLKLKICHLVFVAIKDFDIGSQFSVNRF
jgi:hypothetical protein